MTPTWDLTDTPLLRSVDIIIRDQNIRRWQPADWIPVPDLYLFEDPDEPDALVLHVPSEPGSMLSVCLRSFTDDDIYLPDDDQAIADFCPVCAPAWIDYKTINTHHWRNEPS